MVNGGEQTSIFGNEQNTKDTETLFIEKMYSPGSSCFSDIGQGHKIDIRTVYGKGILKDAFEPGIYDYFVEELVYHLAQQVSVPCVFTKVLKVEGEYKTFSRYEFHEMVDLIDLQHLTGLTDPQSFDEIYLKLSEQLRQKFLTVMAFDVLTRQLDRNVTNLMYNHRASSFYPLFDNGIALFSHVYDETLSKVNMSMDFRMRYDRAPAVINCVRRGISIDTRKRIMSWEVDLDTALGVMEIPSTITSQRIDVIRQ